LFDLYAGADPATKTGFGSDVSPENASPCPWRLTVHFSDWPDEDLVRLDEKGMVMNDAFINSVKEADFLRNGTAKGIMSLSKEDSSGLWKAVENGKFCTPQNYLEYMKLTKSFCSGPSIFPAYFSHSSTSSISTIPQRAYSYLLTAAPR
jgi:hypothetical protein